MTPSPRLSRSKAPAYRPTQGDILFYAALAAVLAVCALGGGSSRADVWSLLYLRPVVIGAIVTMLVVRAGQFEWAAIRIPLVLLAAMAIVITLQLVPLPPALWAALPGHDTLAEHLALLGMADVWRPLSLVPELTLNSLLALLPPLAILIGLAGTRPYEREAMIYVVAGVGVASAMLGVVQLVSGHGYFYRYSDDALPIGFFTNRNHQAAMLAICLPALRILSLQPRKTPSSYLFQLGVCSATGLFLLLMILLTGSRSGIVMALLALVTAALIRQPSRGSGVFARAAKPHSRSRRSRTMLRALIVLAPLSFIALAYLSGRAASVNRLLNFDTVLGDQRVTYAPITWKIAREFFPLGSGAGTFDRVYRLNEPDWALHQNYFNHAHNDLVEIIITGGLPFLLILAAFAIWFLVSAYQAYRDDGQRQSPPGETLFSIGAITIFLAASLTDYHIRTPLIAIAFAFACGLLSMQRYRAGNIVNR
jgi:O-antigen ligase